MLDRFKFRFWHRKESEMYDVECIDFEMKTVTVITFFNEVQRYIVIDLSEGELMQCTGIDQDSEIPDNNNLIFVHDIVEVLYEGEKVICKVAIEFGMIIFISNKFNDGFKHLSDLVSIDGEYAWIEGCKVIGNAYENPELL